MSTAPSSPTDMARALGLHRAADLFPDDVAAAHGLATANRALLPPAPLPQVKPWVPPSTMRP